jgi:N-acetyl sugar amidotransferase
MPESISVPSKFIPSNYQVCTKTVMDNIADPNIRFDENGVCNYYHEYFKNLPKEVADPEYARKKLSQLQQRIEDLGKGKAYDSIVGVSGGVDSTYIALKVKEMGLRPLVVHFDNGWNSEIAVKNIENIVQKLGYDLYTHVFEWEEFKDIQLAFFKANVIDIEAITDIAIQGVLAMLAAKFRIRFVISGHNYKTESVLPKAWIYKDYFNLIDIHKKFGTRPISLFPYYDSFIHKVKLKLSPAETVFLLNLLDYDKKKAKQEIIDKLEWRDYGGKHYESVFTRFYQGYILPKKFGIDKRKAHLTNLICSGQITREAAIKELEAPIYDPDQLRADYDFALKKLGFSEQDFEEYINTPGRPHLDFDTEAKYLARNKVATSLKKLFNRIRS